MDPTAPGDRRSRRHPLRAAIRGLLLTSLPPNGIRLIDIAVLFVGIPVAVAIGLPILLITVIVGLPIGFLLVELGAPENVRTVYGLGVFGIGLGLCLAVFVRVYRRLPAFLRDLVAEEDPQPPLLGFDPGADVSTLDGRVAAADARLTDDRDAAGDDP